MSDFPNYTKIDPGFLAQLASVLGAENVFTDDVSLADYSHDETKIFIMNLRLL